MTGDRAPTPTVADGSTDSRAGDANSGLYSALHLTTDLNCTGITSCCGVSQTFFIVGESLFIFFIKENQDDLMTWTNNCL